MRLNTGPITRGLQGTIRIGRAREKIVGKRNAVPDKNLILNRDSFANKGMAGNLTAIADFRPFLNLDESSDLHIITNLTAIEIRETEYTDPFAQNHIWGDLLMQAKRSGHFGRSNIDRAIGGDYTAN